MQYIILDGKKPSHSFKDGKGAKTWEEVKDFDNIGVIVPENYVVLDFDTTSDAEIMLKIVESLDLKCRVMKTTRGIHCWFKSPEDDPKNFIKNRLAIGIYADRKAGGRNAYVKIKQDGKPREWLKKPRAEDLEVVPRWLYSVSAPADRFNFKELGEESGRNQALFDYILFLQSKGFNKEDIRKTIRIINDFVFADPLPNSEIETILRDEAFNDDVIAEAEKKKYVFQHNLFAEEIIAEHNLIHIDGVIYEYLDGYYQAAELLNKNIRTKKPDIKRNQLNEVVSYIRDMNNIRSVDLETNPYIINLKNTRLNIATGERLAFTPEAIEFDRIPVIYNPSARCPDLDKMLERVFCGDREIITLFGEIMGYILMKSCEYHTAFIFYGDGSNGKSTILDLIKTFLGKNNYSAIPLEHLGDRFSKVQLDHKLANIGDDLNDTNLKDTGTIKQIISGATIQVERKGENAYNMTPYATHIFACNEIPKSFDKSDGFYRRWIYVPFNARFSISDQDYDPLIKQKITTPDALSYLLNIAIAGAQRLIKNKGFTEPEKSKRLKAEYQVENSLVLTWLEEENKTLEYILETERKTIYIDFCDWCTLSRIKTPTGKQNVFAELRKHFKLDKKDRIDSSGKRFFKELHS